MRQLASKAYWAQFQTSPEFAVLFLPGDQFLSAALAERPELIDNAMKTGHHHCHALDADRAAEIGRLRLAPVGGGAERRRSSATSARSSTAGSELSPDISASSARRLGGAIEAYNAAVGSLERQVLPQARRFPDLGVTADAPLPSSSRSRSSCARVALPSGAMSADS